jgi:hypothetical protein
MKAGDSLHLLASGLQRIGEKKQTGTSAAEAALDCGTVIAALKRCATQNRIFSAEVLRHAKSDLSR